MSTVFHFFLARGCGTGRALRQFLVGDRCAPIQPGGAGVSNSCSPRAGLYVSSDNVHTAVTVLAIRVGQKSLLFFPL